MLRWLLMAALLTVFAGPSAADEARLLLSWRAPFGFSRALENLSAPCDSSGVDTLYLSFDPGRDAPTFLGMSATLYFHAAEGDSLGDFWRIADMNQRGSPLRASFDSDSARGFQTPFESPGAGEGRYDYSAGSGRIRMIYAVAANAASPVKAGHMYGLARVMVRHPRSGMGGCGQPICVEWHVATLAFGASDVVDENRGARLVSINSPNGKVCDAYRSTNLTPVWKPKPPKL